MKDLSNIAISQKNNDNNRQRGFEEIINFCGDYEKEIDFRHETQIHEEMLQKHHQFGSISFYTSTISTPSASVTPKTWSPVNTLQQKR